jgi:hypothetical protein
LDNFLGNEYIVGLGVYYGNKDTDWEKGKT